jgi:hypothetical protein
MRERHRLPYQSPDSPRTLREGLEELRDGLSPADRVDDAMARDLFFHDVCHVVFGQGTSVEDDVVVDVWIVFGTDVDSRAYLRALVRSRALQDLMARDGMGRVALGLVRAVPRAILAFARSRRMSKPWPWAGATEHLDRRLVEIRREFGIRLG